MSSSLLANNVDFLNRRTNYYVFTEICADQMDCWTFAMYLLVVYEQIIDVRWCTEKTFNLHVFQNDE